MRGLDVSQAVGAGTGITSTQLVTPSGSYPYCEVKGTIAPQIQFEVLLPTKTWRRRYLQTGCGGFCGSVEIYAERTDGCVPLTRGDFVIATNNEGHVGVSGFDGTFGADPQLRVDFGYRSDHVVALVAKGLIALYYGRARATPTSTAARRAATRG